MDIFKQRIAEMLASATGLTAKETVSLLETPPQKDMGDFAFPCFVLAKKFKKAPQQIAKGLVAEIKDEEILEKVEENGPYLNFFLARDKVAAVILTLIKEKGEKYGCSDLGENKNVVIDFSAPNIAKPFGIGHLRSTVIGNSLYRIYEALGFNAVGINHLGDWGTQFGKLIVAYKVWGQEERLEEDPIKYLYELYVKFHQEAEKNSALEDEGRKWFKRLENGDPEAIELWEKFRQMSLQEFKRVYDKLGIKFDSYQGESFYNDKLKSTIEKIKEKGITRESEGALIVDLEEDMPPCLLQKNDGATLYATRDLAAAMHRFETYDFAKMLYVVGVDQTLHFRQLFAVLEGMEYKWVEKCYHVPFGMIRFKDGKMSTRQGKMIMLEEVLDKAIKLSLDIIEEKNPDLNNKEDVAAKVGIGAIIFADLSNDRVKNIEFDWAKVLDFSGETAPYVQYSHARICSILRKAGDFDSATFEKGSLLASGEEKSLIVTLGNFPEIVKKSAETNKPSHVARYLIEVARSFNQFYHNCAVLSAEDDLRQARLTLVDATRQVLANGMYLLGIEMPEEM